MKRIIFLVLLVILGAVFIPKILNKDTLGGVAGFVGDGVKGAGNLVKDGANVVVDGAGAVVDGAEAVAKGAVEVTGDVAKGAGNLVKDGANAVVDGAGAVAKGAVEVTGDVAQGAIDAAGTVVGGVTDVASGAVDGAANVVKGTGEALADGAKAVVGEVDRVIPKLGFFGDRQVITAGKVFFQTGKADLDAKSYDTLNDVATFITQNNKIKKVVVEGHTDATGNAAANKILSEQRAANVKAYLLKKGIDSARLDAKGFGSEKPIGSSNEANRRVEFVVEM